MACPQSVPPDSILFSLRILDSPLVGAPAPLGESNPMKRSFWGLLFAVVAVAATAPAQAQTWRQVGPPGGTVISLAADPSDANRLYLGTADGHVFVSGDEA